MIAGTNWGRKKLFLPIASASTGATAHTLDMRLKAISPTSSRSLVDTSYIKDIYDYQHHIPKLKNKITIIYGEHDRMKKTRFSFVKEFIEIPNSGHNVFVHEPHLLIKVLRSLL
jgi:pimeloyl-ACP methyl ester carboxylesterase